MNLGDAITIAIDECIEKGILLDILIEERVEVYMYILESFDKELYERDLKQDAYEEGANDKLISLIKIKLSKGKTVEQIAEELEETEETITNLLSQMKKD